MTNSKALFAIAAAAISTNALADVVGVATIDSQAIYLTTGKCKFPVEGTKHMKAALLIDRSTGTKMPSCWELKPDSVYLCWLLAPGAGPAYCADLKRDIFMRPKSLPQQAF